MPVREFFWLSHLKWEDPPQFHNFEGEKIYLKSRPDHLGAAYVKDTEEACSLSACPHSMASSLLRDSSAHWRPTENQASQTYLTKPSLGRCYTPQIGSSCRIKVQVAPKLNLANQWAFNWGHLQKQKWLIDSYITKTLPPKDRWQLKQQQKMWT